VGVAHLEHMYRLGTDACEMVEFKEKLNKCQDIYALDATHTKQHRDSRFKYADDLNEILTTKKTANASDAMTELQAKLVELAPFVVFETRHIA
jgi:hypothetical protein